MREPGALPTSAAWQGLLAHPRALWGILLLIGGVYAGVASAGWFWDDARLILLNPVVQQLDALAAFQHHLWWGVAPEASDGLAYWRPLVLVSFFLDHVVAADAPGFPHLHNLAWHLLVVALVHVAARPHLGATRAAVAALFAGLHPAASGAVLWVSARNDLMCAAAILGALCAADRDKPVLAGVLAAAAGMCKEIGFATPVFVLAWQLAWAAPGVAVSRRPLIGAAVGTALALALRTAADVPPGVWQPEAYAASVALPFGLAQLTLPWPLCGVVWLPALTPGAFAPGALLTVGLLAALVWDAPRRAGLLVGLVLLAWAPTVVASAATARAGEWYLYVPLVFLAFPVASAARRWTVAPLALIGVAWLVVLGLRIGEWTDDETLTRATLDRAPSSLAWARLGAVLDAQGRVDEALDAYTRGLDTTPTFTRACASPVRMLRRVGREADATAFGARFPCASAASGGGG